MDFFTSDLHIGHDKTFIWRERGFSSVEEHDTTILKNWNEVVTPKDTVYILGDLAMGGNEKVWNEIFFNLNGTKYFVEGNHDTIKKNQIYQEQYHILPLGIASYYHYSKNKKFLLSHYPTMVGNYTQDKFFWNLSGHTHSKNKFEYGQYNIYNVAVDAHNCTPVSIEQILKDIQQYQNRQK